MADAMATGCFTLFFLAVTTPVSLRVQMSSFVCRKGAQAKQVMPMPNPMPNASLSVAVQPGLLFEMSDAARPSFACQCLPLVSLLQTRNKPQQGRTGEFINFINSSTFINSLVAACAPLP